MSTNQNERAENQAVFEENYIDENIIADKSSKTREFIKDRKSVV